MTNNKQKKILRLAAWLAEGHKRFEGLTLGDVRVISMCIYNDMEVPAPRLTLNDCYAVVKELPELGLDEDQMARAVLLGVNQSTHFDPNYASCSMCHRRKKMPEEMSRGQHYCRQCKREYNRDTR